MSTNIQEGVVGSLETELREKLLAKHRNEIHELDMAISERKRNYDLLTKYRPQFISMIVGEKKRARYSGERYDYKERFDRAGMTISLENSITFDLIVDAEITIERLTNRSL